MLYYIFKIFNFLDSNLRDINKVINEEIVSGGQFEKLVFPIAELNQFKVIQFFKDNQKYGMIAGLGADKRIEISYLKAIVEYFERMAFYKNENKYQLQSTNGVAAHRLTYFAKINAQNELLERDSFLRHWYSNTGFISLDLTNKETALNEVLKLNNLEILMGETFLGFKKTYICFLKDQNTNGFALGLSCGRNNGDREKAIQEAVINYFFGNQGKSKEEQIVEIKKNGVNSLESHRAYWLYIKKIPSWIFKEKGTKPPIQSRLNSTSTFKLLEDYPFKVIHCQNDELIPLTVGSFSNFYSQYLTKDNLNVVLGSTQYHPIP